MTYFFSFESFERISESFETPFEAFGWTSKAF